MRCQLPRATNDGAELMKRRSLPARRDQYGRRINRDHSPVLLTVIPWGSIMVAALLPIFILATAIPLVPPLALLFLLAWRLVRPGVVPVWVGLPLGLWTDLFSGQPFGFSVLLFSIILLAIEAVEARFPWSDFKQDWATACISIVLYLVAGVLFSGANITLVALASIAPQALLTVLAFPIIARMVAALDRLRLLRVRVIH